jgi:5'-phosphate synthase pdxT subunit
VDVVRNAYGRQKDSFEAVDDSGTLPLVFIRAPRLVRVGPSVDVLATLGGEPVLVRSGRLYGAAFHPEISEPPALHARIFGGAAWQDQLPSHEAAGLG